MGVLGKFNVETDELDVTFLRNGDVRLNEPLFFEQDTVIWYALPGLVSDGASIPQFLWDHLGHPFYGPFLRSALLHDHYYRDDDHSYSRAQVDRMFYDAIRVDGAGRIVAAVAYMGVRLGGRGAWNRVRVKSQ